MEEDERNEEVRAAKKKKDREYGDGNAFQLITFLLLLLPPPPRQVCDSGHLPVELVLLRAPLTQPSCSLFSFSFDHGTASSQTC